MRRSRTKSEDRVRQGPLVLVLLVAFLGANLVASSCSPDPSNSLALGPPSDPPAVPPGDSTPVVDPQPTDSSPVVPQPSDSSPIVDPTPPDSTPVVDPGPPTPPPPPPPPPPPGPTPGPPQPTGPPQPYTGIPFGPFGLWNITQVNWGPRPFTGSHNFINASAVIQQISSARALGQRLVLAMTGGLSSEFVTNGQFDMGKWKRRMDTYNDDAIKKAVAAAVTDGTVVGNTLIDEPETRQWGTNLTKAMIDDMATYAKNIFPTLPVGVNHGPPAYNRWRTTERYRVVDYVLYQYAYYVSQGDVAKWRDAVLAQAKSEGAAAALSLNVMNGGAQDREGDWDCGGQGQAGRGTRLPNCRMTTAQLRTWGEALAPYGCFLTLWRFDGVYMSNPSNLDAFRYLATVTGSQPRKSCKRPGT